MGELISMYFLGSFIQWSLDSVDHNVKTLDGKGTPHAMGIVCVAQLATQRCILSNDRKLRNTKALL